MWKCVIESTCLVTSLDFVHARMVKTGPKIVNEKNIFLNNKGQIPTLLHSLQICLCTIPRLKCENGSESSECGIGMDCPVSRTFAFALLLLTFSYQIIRLESP